MDYDRTRDRLRTARAGVEYTADIMAHLAYDNCINYIFNSVCC